MKRGHRHLSFLLGALALLLVVFLARPTIEPPRVQIRPPEPPAASAAAAAPAPVPLTTATNPALFKQAEGAIAKSKPPITMAAAGGPARFVLRDQRVNAFFTPAGIAISLLGRMDGKRSDPSRPSWGLHWGIVGAKEVEPRAEGMQESKVHVLKGKPEEWKVDQAAYARVVYPAVKPGIDLVVDAAKHGVKYSLFAAKAAAVAALRLRYAGASALQTLDGGRALEISAGEGKLKESGLIVTQEGRAIEASYRVTGSDEYAIDLQGADPDKPLEIDPEIGWSTYLGSVQGQGGGGDIGYAIKVDAAGAIYVGGFTYSADFPIAPALPAVVYDRDLTGYQDGFVTKFNSAGAVVWSTYVGGSSYDQINALAIDGSGNVYVTGSTDSADFPVTSGAADNVFQGGESFALRINADGTGIAWSTFLGGGNSDYGRGIAVDAAGASVWVAGETYSDNFPTFAAFDSSPSGLPDGFVTKLAPSGTATSFVYSSYLGGNNTDVIHAIAVDGAGALFATGYTYSTDFPTTVGAHRTAYLGGAECFVVKVKPAATSLDWGTYLGGSNSDYGYAITVDASGNSYVTGHTNSTNFPMVANTYSWSTNGDAFLTKIASNGATLGFSTYFGGNDYEEGRAIVLDSAVPQRVIIAGYTYSTSFPLGNVGGQPTMYDTGPHNGATDVFISGWSTTGPILWSTYAGGTSYDIPHGMAVDGSNTIYLTGSTESPPGAPPTAFPLAGAFDNTLGSGQDGFVIRLTTNSPTMTLTLGTYLGGANGVGNDYGRRVAVDNTGAIYVTGVSYGSDFPTPGGFQTAVASTPDITVTKYSNLATPTLVWSTYLGGNSYEEVTGIGVDNSPGPSNGQVYVTGNTSSANFPMAPPMPISGFQDGFVTKLLASGGGLAWSRFLGGTNDDYPQALAVNAAGDVVVTGYTYSSAGFPLSGSTFQSVASSLPDGFVTLIPSNGVGITWSTYLGSTDTDVPLGVAFDSSGGKVVVGGWTYSAGFPVTPGTATQAALSGPGTNDFFVSRFNPALLGASQLEFSTFFGGPEYDNFVDLAIGPGDNIFLLGDVYYGGFPRTTGPVWQGSDDAVIVKINAGGTLAWSRYLGGSSTDYPNRICVDNGGSPIVTGYTYSIDFPVQGAFQGSNAGSADAFVTKIDNGGGTLDWSTYLGGSNYDYPYGLAIFSGGAVYVVGETSSGDFPKKNPTDGAINGSDYFVTRIDNSNPTAPTAASLLQFKIGGAISIPTGSFSNQTSFVAKGTIGDLDDDNVALQVEIKPIDVPFANTPGFTGTLGAGGANKEVTVDFPAGTQRFHWQARTIDVHTRTSNWVSAGSNLDNNPPTTNAAVDIGRDITNPTLTLSTPTTGAAYTTASTPIVFTGGFSDPGSPNNSGVSSVSWNVMPSNTNGGASLNFGSSTWTSTSIPLSLGVNTITFSVTDAAGNTPTGTQVTVTYDIGAPSTSITAPTTNGNTFLTGTGTSTSLPPTGTIALSGTSTDNFLVNSVTWTNSTGGTGSATLNAGTTSRTWSATVPVSPGGNTISVVTRDGANNPSPTATITVNYDNQPPSLNILSPTNNAITTAASVSLVGAVSDQASPYSNSISSVTWTKSGGGSGGATLNSPVAGQYTTTAVTLSPGANVITVTAIDGVPVSTRSNLNVQTSSITVYQDIADPGITIGSPAVSPFTTGNSTITVSGNATDDLGVTSVTYTNSAAVPPSTVFPATLGAGTTSRTWSADVSLALGINNLVFTVSDGCTPPRTKTASITIDYSNTAPSILVSNPSASTTVVSSNSIVVSGTATPAAPKTIQGVTVENLTTGIQQNAGTTNWSATVNLVIGDNTIQIIATDSAMPTGLTTTVNRTVIYDPTAPAVTITGPTGAATYASPVNSVVLSGVATDNRVVSTVKWNNLTTVSGDVNATLNPGPAASLTWTTAAIPLQAGDNSIRIRATDEAGLFTDDTITVTYDTTSPGITITSPTSASTHTVTVNNVTLGGNASDNFQLQSVTWVNAARGESGAANAPLTAWTTPSITLNPGANVITLVAIDAAGNNTTDSITVYYDTAPPVVTITSPTSDAQLYTATDSLTLGGTASDDITVAQITWSTDASVSPSSGIATGDTNWSIPSIPLALGVNNITVTVSDGIRPTVSDTIQVIFDNVSPSIAITSPLPTPPALTVSTTITPVSIGGTAGDNQSVTEISWTNTTTGGSGAVPNAASWTCQVPLTSGDNVIVVTARDAAGNTDTDTVTVTYDPAAPLISITSPTSGISISTSTTPITIGGTAGDDVGVASVTWTTTSAVTTTAGNAGTSDAYATWSFGVDLAPGENVITVTATDGVARTGTSFLTIIYDPTAPQVTITSPTTDPTYRTTQATLTIGGLANDNFNLQSVGWSNAATGDSGATQGLGAWSIPSMPLLEGSNLVTVTATDSVNNVGSKTITVSYDGTDPLLSVDPFPPLLATFNGTEWDTSTRPFPFTGTAFDMIGLASVTWVNVRPALPADIALGSGGAVLTPDGSGGFTWSAPIYFSAGINRVTFTATDDHGRIATAQFDFNFTPEGSAPLINITTPVPPTAVSATQVVSLAGDSTDNVGVVAITWKNSTTRIRGDAVPGVTGPPADFSLWSADIPLTRGANVIVMTAVDDAGNTATASITVTYSPATTDTTEPVATIQLPSNTGGYTAASSPVVLSVDATDVGDGVAGVYWTNSGTGGAGGLSPDVSPAWVGPIALALGTNVIKVTVVDASGNTATDTIIVTFVPAAPDGAPPSITILTPPPAVTYNTAMGTVTVTGIASDLTAVAEVVYLNGATLRSGSAEGTTAWTADVTLDPGVNVLTFTAYDTSGNTLPTQLTVVYTPPPPPPEVVPAGSCGLLGLDAVLALLAVAGLRRRRTGWI